VRSRQLFSVAACFGCGVAIGACSPATFHCASDEDCGAMGTCQADAFCSFPDEECGSGQRYGEYAGDLAGKCVGEDGTSSSGDPTVASSISTTLTTSVSTTADSSGESDTTPVTVTVTDTGTTTTTSTTTDSHDTGPSESSDTGAPLDPDLVAWYRFELANVPGLDETENHLDGVCDASCPVLVEGVVGSAAQFDGEDDHVRVPDADLFHTTEAWTVALWLRADVIDPVDLRAALSRAYGPEFLNTYEVYYNDWVGQGMVQLHFGFASLAASDRIAAPDEAPVGQWMHGAGTWGDGLAMMYVDGAVVGELEMPTSLFDDHDLVIGGDQNNEGPVSAFWPGAIDEVRIYRRALTADEISTLWASEVP
jgi:hypothetical protein